MGTLRLNIRGEGMAELVERLSADTHAAQMADYLDAGRDRALALGNRGPLRLTDEGALHPDILTAYREHGFYVFERLIRGNGACRTARGDR